MEFTKKSVQHIGVRDGMKCKRTILPLMGSIFMPGATSEVVDIIRMEDKELAEIAQGEKVMKKIFIISFMIVGIFMIGGCSRQNTGKMPQLVIGSDEYRPYNYTDEDGEPAGIDVELAQEACRRMGYEPVFKHIEWNQRDEYLADGEVDCLWSCYPIDKNEEYEWVGPYMYSRQVVAVLEDSPIYTLSDLEGKSVVVRVGSQAEDIFLKRTDKNIPQVKNVYSLNDVDEIITALRNNYVDACAGYGATVTVLLNNAGVSYRFLEEDLSRAELGIAFPKNSDSALRTQLETTLEEMHKDGTMGHILEGYGLNEKKALGEE